MEHEATQGRNGEMPALPNLLILGAAKSGTSSLHSYIGQHPDIYMTAFKEPHFFVWEGRAYDIQGPGVARVGRGMIRDKETYSALFSDATNERILGESSTGYLHTVGVAERIRRHVPSAHLVAILRNPVDRAYSAFRHAQREGLEPLSNMADALAEEADRLRDRWIGLTLYVTVGRYAEQLERYRSVFPCKQLRVYLFDDLQREPVRVAQDVFRFLKVDDSFEPDVSTQENRGSTVRSVRLRQLARAVRETRLGRRLPTRMARRFLHAVNETPVGAMSGDLRERLSMVFEPDVSRVSRMLDRDLSPWLRGEPVPAPRTGKVGMHPCG